MTTSHEFDMLADELERQGWRQEAALLRRFPRAAWDDDLVRGMFVAATNVKDVRRAEKIARRLVAFAPDNPFAHLALALVLLRAEKVGEAARAFERACHFASTFPHYRAQKIHLACLLDRLEEAQRLLRETLKEFADRWEVQLAQAHVWLASGKTEQALRLLRKIVRHRPANPLAYALLTQALWQQGAREQAKETLRQMAKFLPPLSFTDATAFLAHALAKQTLAFCLCWLRPKWWIERWWLKWQLPRYFLAVGILWGTVAVLLACLRFLLPLPFPPLLTILALMAFLYERFGDAFILWRLRG